MATSNSTSRSQSFHHTSDPSTARPRWVVDGVQINDVSTVTSAEHGGPGRSSSRGSSRNPSRSQSPSTSPRIFRAPLGVTSDECGTTVTNWSTRRRRIRQGPRALSLDGQTSDAAHLFALSDDFCPNAASSNRLIGPALRDLLAATTVATVALILAAIVILVVVEAPPPTLGTAAATVGPNPRVEWLQLNQLMDVSERAGESGLAVTAELDLSFAPCFPVGGPAILSSCWAVRGFNQSDFCTWQAVMARSVAASDVESLLATDGELSDGDGLRARFGSLRFAVFAAAVSQSKHDDFVRNRTVANSRGDRCDSFGEDPTSISVWTCCVITVVAAAVCAGIGAQREATFMESCVDAVAADAAAQMVHVAVLTKVALDEFDLLLDSSAGGGGAVGVCNASSEHADSGSPSYSTNVGGSSRRPSRNIRESSFGSLSAQAAVMGPSFKHAQLAAVTKEELAHIQEFDDFNGAISQLVMVKEGVQTIARNNAKLIPLAHSSPSALSLPMQSPRGWRGANHHQGVRLSSMSDDAGSPTMSDERRRSKYRITSTSGSFSDTQSDSAPMPPPAVRSPSGVGRVVSGGAFPSLVLRRTSIALPTVLLDVQSLTLGAVVDNAEATPVTSETEHPFAVPSDGTPTAAQKRLAALLASKTAVPSIAVVCSDSEGDSGGEDHPAAPLAATGTAWSEKPFAAAVEEDDLLNTIASLENGTWHRSTNTHPYETPPSMSAGGGAMSLRAVTSSAGFGFLSVDFATFGSSGGAGSLLSSPAESPLAVMKRRVSKVSEALMNVRRRSHRGSHAQLGGDTDPSLADRIGSPSADGNRSSPTRHRESSTPSAPDISPMESLLQEKLGDIITFDLRKSQGVYMHFAIHGLFEDDDFAEPRLFGDTPPEVPSLSKRKDASVLGQISMATLHAHEFLSQLCLAVITAAVRAFDGVITTVTATTVVACWNAVRPYPFSEKRATLCAQHVASGIEELLIHLEMTAGGDTSASGGGFGTSGEGSDNASAAWGQFGASTPTSSVGVASPTHQQKMARSVSGMLQPALRRALDAAIISHKISPSQQRIVARTFRDKWAIALSAGPACVGVSGTRATMITSLVGDAISVLPRLWRLAVQLKSRILITDTLAAGAKSHSHVVPVDFVQHLNGEIRLVFEVRSPLENSSPLLRDALAAYTAAVTQFSAGNYGVAAYQLQQYIDTAFGGATDAQARRLLNTAKCFAAAQHESDSSDSELHSRVASFPRLSSIQQRSGRTSTTESSAKRGSVIDGGDSSSGARGYIRKMPGWLSYEAEAEKHALLTSVGTAADDQADTTTITPLTTTRTNNIASARAAPSPLSDSITSKLRDQIRTRHERKVSRDSAALSSGADDEDEAASLTASQRGTTSSNGSSLAGHAFVDDQRRVWRCSDRVLGEGAFGKVYMGMASSGELVAIKIVPLGDAVLEASPSSSPRRGVVHENSASSPMGSPRGGVVALWRNESFKRTPKDHRDGGPATFEALISEIGMLSRFQHANIVSYLSTIVTQDSLVIVTEYVAGGSITQLLQRFGPLPTSTVKGFLKGILNGLAMLHRNGTMHCDISTNNILVANDGTCKLADFGCSLPIGALTRSVTGTPCFMPPEASIGRNSKACDVWAVGVIALYLVTGQLPFAEPLVASPADLVQRLEAVFNDREPPQEARRLFRRVLLPESWIALLTDPNSVVAKSNPMFHLRSGSAMQWICTGDAGTLTTPPIHVDASVESDTMDTLMLLSMAQSCLGLDSTKRPTVENLLSHGLFMH